MNSGGFNDVEDVIMQALVSAPAPEPRHRRTGQELIDVCAKVRGLLTDEEVDTLLRADNRLDIPDDSG